MKNLFEILPATKKDIPIIFGFIKKLAETGEMTHELVATEAILEKSLFGDNNYAEVVIGYINKQAVSYALFTHNFSTLFGKPGLYLVDLFVSQEARKLGVGRSMLIYLAKLAKERDCCRFEWAVLNKNEQAIGLYKNIGAKEMSQWTTYRISGDTLNKLSDEKITTVTNWVNI